MKKFLAVVLTMCIFFSMCLPAYAAETSNEDTCSEFQFSEYDVFTQLQAMSDDELSAAGYTATEIVELKSTTYNELLLERAALPCERLAELGYTDEEIGMLKNYHAGIIVLNDFDLYALAGVCTGKIGCNFASQTEFYIVYEWSWDHCPFVNGTDAMAIRWCAYGFDGNYVDVDLDYDHGLVTYYLNDRPYNYQGVYSTPSLEFNTLSYSFPMAWVGDRDAWAKEGSISIQLRKDPSITRNIHHVKVAGLYGHSVINMSAPSISIGGGDIGISFSGNVSVDNIAGAKAKVLYDETIENI